MARSPYRVKAVQVDGGSEFQAEFEQACQAKGIKAGVLPATFPKLNGHVERAQRTHTERSTTAIWVLGLKQVNKAMRQWEYVYNHIRITIPLRSGHQPSILLSTIGWPRLHDCLQDLLNRYTPVDLTAQPLL